MSVEKKTILVADDDRDQVKVLRDRLEYHGYETFAAYEGTRVIEIAHKKKPDLILLDLNMPSGNGKTVLKNLREHYETEKIPVIVVTGMCVDEFERELHAIGGDEYVLKPYDVDDLLGRIHSHIG